jgi:GH15 family glucan-1,4-alpha-glucosidase
LARIEDYALIGDTHSAALVSRAGSIDWLCLPRFDSASCFGALLGGAEAGFWSVAPIDDVIDTSRAYRGETMVLESTFVTKRGTARVVDCLPLEESSDPHDPRQIVPEDLVLRVVTCVDGRVSMKSTFAPRFDYGHIAPWLRRIGKATVQAIGGPDSLDLRASVPLEINGCEVVSEFELDAGEEAVFLGCYHASHLRPDHAIGPEDAAKLLARTERFWQDWVGRCPVEHDWRDEVVRSLLTLKALTHSPTGGIVAAPTTSLPERIGGVRNWDYRFCWLRDATFTLQVLLDHGYTGEAREWRDWLMRAVAGDPEDLQIMYGVTGERRLYEHELDWLEGYEGSRPVRVGNAATEQFQLDVYGEVMDALHSARRAGIETTAEEWALQRDIVEFVCEHWREPDEGIWEVRSGREHFVHSKVMAWVAVDRAIGAVEEFGAAGPVEHWRAVREEIHEEVLRRGFDDAKRSFTRAYGDPELDASLLMLPLVGFLPPDDARVVGTVEAVQRELMVDGLVQRYRSEVVTDGLPPGEGTFLLCTFWLVDCLILIGRRDEARTIFDRLLELRNDVGLLSEQYDVELGRLVGNFPQAFSHVALATSAYGLEDAVHLRSLRRAR